MSVQRAMFPIAAVLAAASFAIDSFAATAQTRTVASATLGNDRAVVVATKTSGGPAPTANVAVVTYIRSGSGWERVGVHRLAGTFFWKTVTSEHGLCRFALVRTPAPIHVVVRPRITPSIGCGTPVTFAFPSRH